MNTTNILMLDFGVYAKDSALHNVAKALNQDAENEIIKLEPATMLDQDWDDVLDKILSARRCVVL